MFSKAIVVVVVLANVFYAQCRPGPVSGDINVPELNEEAVKSILSNPTFNSYLQQLVGYFSSLQGQPGQSQGSSGSQSQGQIFQSQQTSSQSNSQQATAISQHSPVAAVEQSQQTQEPESVEQEQIHSAESQVINQSEKSRRKRQSSHLLQQGTFHQSSANKVIQSSSQQKTTSNIETKQTTSNVDESSASRLLQNEANKVILNKNTASHTNLQQKGVNFQKTIYDGEHAQNAKHDGRYYYDSEDRIRAPNAKYDWAYLVDDNINGNYQMREESRHGGKVTGKYAYDDGNIMRTVHYEADEHGFRILKDESVDSVKAVTHLDGHAFVKTYRDGDVLDYQISQTKYK